MSLWPTSGGPIGWPVTASHTRTVVLPAETIRLPSELNVTLDTGSVVVIGGPIGFPVPASHCRTVLSQLPETIRDPSELNATLLYPVGVTGEGLAARLAGVGVPHPHGLVGATGDDPPPVGAERHTGHRVRVAGQRAAYRVAGGGVPHPHHLVDTAVNDPAPVAAECAGAVHVQLRPFSDLDDVFQVGQRTQQSTVIGHFRQSSPDNKLLVRTHWGARAGAGQHRLCLGNQPPRYCFISLAIRLLLFHDGDASRRRSDDGQHG